LVINEILAIWSFNLDQLLREIVAEHIGRGFYKIIELIIESTDVKAMNFESKVAKTELLAFEILDLIFFSFNFTAIEKCDDETA
jgi:hypothetical protein